MSRARPVTFPQRPLEEGKSLEAPQSVQDRFQGVSPRSDSKFRFRQGSAGRPNFKNTPRGGPARPTITAEVPIDFTFRGLERGSHGDDADGP